MSLGKMEMAIMAAMERAPKKVWSLEDLSSVAYKDRELPEHWRSSLQCMMRSLILKTSASSKSIKRISSLGRGNKAAYQLNQVRERKRAFLSGFNNR